MKKLSIVLSILLINLCMAQAQDIPKSSTYLEISGAVGASNFSGVGALRRDWHIGKKKHFVLGTGVRFTGFSGKKLNFITAPANLTSDKKNLDTLYTPTPYLYSLNLIINLGWRFSEKIQVGFDIDAVGISFGPTGSPTFIHNGQPQATSASPTSPNVLLLDDRNRGSISAQYHVLYRFSPHFGAKVGLQHLFSELTTATKVQTVPEANDRFRYKSYAGFIGLNYTF